MTSTDEPSTDEPATGLTPTDYLKRILTAQIGEPSLKRILGRKRGHPPKPEQRTADAKPHTTPGAEHGPQLLHSRLIAKTLIC